ncbi:protein ACCELERATED CELL DEATH 6-like [Silene latifolia]|uniref:protein ACCELERATED CELL DEATH 6-like n=1 Tax=Silene latifolia TaxID=37657 RepID=UPI003D76CC8F
MDPALKEAAISGDVEFLKEAFSKQPLEYFLTQSPRGDGYSNTGNIFHLAARNNKEEFMREAMSILPKDIQKRLLFQVDDYSQIPLHAAVVMSYDSYNIFVLMKQMYASFSLSYEDDEDGLVKPWLALTVYKRTPLHLALTNGNEKCAMEILTMDTEFESCTIVDSDGNTPLYYALEKGFSLVAETILMSPLSSSSIFPSTNDSTPFTYAARCSDVVLRLLFEKYPDWLDKIVDDDKGFTILHRWAEDGEARPCKLLLEGGVVGEARAKIFKRTVFVKENKIQNTPLHIAAGNKDSELAQIIIRGYQQQQVSAGEGEIQELVPVECPPWRLQNRHGNTPLHIALDKTSRHEQLALEILSVDPTLCKIRNNSGESPFFLAATSGCAKVVDAIMKIEEPRFQMLRRNDGATVLHCLSSCPEETGRRLLEKYWWIINLLDDSGKTALDYAKQASALWLVSLLNNPSRIKKEEFDWIEACKREETSAVLAFIDNCQDLQQACRKENDTPLHHIKLPTDKDYVNFLNTPSIAELKNTTDHEGATPLHRALERKDMLLAKVLLLDDEVERIIPDHYGRTSMDLLARLCKENEDWEKMCKQIKVNPYLKTSYIQPRTNLDQIRNTLSVVAALLATITFAAGFTLPGGLDSNSGEAILAKRAVFLVFLLADVYAMCTSMLVLFCLVWSMVSEPDIARLLVDRSVYILMQSLYATLLAFMTGVYTVIAHRSLWAAILVFVMCSVIGIAANRTILHNVIAKLIPTANREENQDQIRLLEEGSVDVPLTERNASSIAE